MKTLSQEQTDRLYRVVDQYIDGVITAKEAINSVAQTLQYPPAE